jgi:hypothetical protein
MPIVNFQDAPKWIQDYAQELINKSRKLGEEKYSQYGIQTPDQNIQTRNEIQKLIAKKKGNVEYDIIPISITGKSEPINVSPPDLINIIKDKNFARQVYENASGNFHVTDEEIDDLRKRSHEKYNFFRENIEQWENKAAQRERRRERHERKEYNKNMELAEKNKNRINSISEEKELLKNNISQLENRRKYFIENISSNEKKLSASTGFNAVGRENEINWFTPDYISQINKDKISLKKIDDELKLKNEEQIKLETEKIGLEEQLSTYTPNKPFELSPAPSAQNLLSRLALDKEIHNLQRKRGQIAPMNEYHERAINMLEKSFNDENMQLAVDELKEAKKYDELKKVEPMVKASLEGPSDAYMQKYIDDYTTDIRKALQDESEEQFIEEIAPKINMSFAQMGAFNSGARAKALRDSLSKHRIKLHRELAALTAGARDKAMEHHELQKRREQSAANLIGETTRSQKLSHRQQAEALKNQAVIKQGLAQLNVAGLSQVAKAKQEQEQHEIDVERQEHQKQLLFPQEQLAREAAILSGLPVPAMQSLAVNLAPSPAPPNLYNIGAGILGSFAGSGIGQQQQQQVPPYKKGGSVRAYYANGGHIGSDDIGNEIRNIIREQSQNDRQRLEHTSHYNPIQSWLRNVGHQMLANPSEDPLLNVARGSAGAMQEADVTKERAANLFDKIQATKLQQYKVLAAYEDMKQRGDLLKENFLEKKRHHQQMFDLKMAKNKNPSEINSKGQELIPTEINFKAQEFIPISSKKEMSDLLKDKKASSSILKDLEEIKKLSNEYEKYNENLFISPRNPLIGSIASDIQSKFSYITQNKNMRKAAVAKSALDSKLEKFKINMETKMRKGVLPEGMRQFMEKKEVFPSSGEPLDVYNKKLEDLLKETKDLYESSDASLRYGIHITPYDIENIRSKKIFENGLSDVEGENVMPPSTMVTSEQNPHPWYEQFGGIAAG